MKTFKHALLAGALVSLSANAFAQSAPLVIGAPAPQNVLREGTEIPMATVSHLSSKKSRVGDRFDLEVTEDVKLNGQVVIPAGSRGVGEVIRSKKSGMWGKSGKLDTRLMYVRVGNDQIRIRGTVGDRGKAGTAGVVASVVLLPVAGFFVKGTQAKLPPRTVATGYLEADLPVVFAGPVGPAPLVVPVAAPAPTLTVAPIAQPVTVQPAVATVPANPK